ncbi:LacI family DNA-binding transcriptional regulator [Microbacterium murale]|uniref:LacI family transcriptional regulator n=1 Tax=Microbacterium murale TaxID=1081040 RepID=A0ABU0P7H0_9MICO|nr:LacI family DNA-binding transcriptional regulator [Microbacterium murale]MDQ0642847.1 LacI family transcriptional regulator [Microbacterium murale]
MTTIADVARLAGVSKATASRTFSRPELVTPGTAQRVHDAADKLGFVVNNAARLLAGGRSGILALAVPTLDNSYFSPIIAGAQARADASGYQLTVVVFPLENVAELPRLARLERQIDGLIVVAPRGTDDLIRSALGTTPTVLVDREIDGVTSVVADTASAFGSLVEQIIRDGHRRIAYVGGPEGSWQDLQRTRAVQEAAHRGRAELTVIGPYASTFAAGTQAAKEVRAFAPTAVIPYATAIGLGVRFSYLMAGDRPPLVSSERSIVEALDEPGSPAIDVDGQELGRVAAEMLIERIGAPEAPAARARLEVSFEQAADR